MDQPADWLGAEKGFEVWGFVRKDQSQFPQNPQYHFQFAGIFEDFRHHAGG